MQERSRRPEGLRRAVLLPAIVALGYASALLFLLDRVEPAPLELPPATAPPPAPPSVDSERLFAQAPPTRAVHYSGRESPLTFWNSDLSTLDRDLARIRRDGFDAVLISIPWGEFQPTLFPPQQNVRAFARLAEVLAAANRHGLGVVARVSVARDAEPTAQLPGRDRMRFVYGDDNVYRAWRTHVAEVGRTLTASPSFRFAVLSWEDFSGIVVDAQTTTSDDVRRRLALDTGFDDYLSARFSLDELSERYARPLSSWRDVRVGVPGTAAFELFVDFAAASLIERFLRPARRELRHVSLELPPLDEGGSSTLPPGAFATVSFSPVAPTAAGAAVVTAGAALRRLSATLRATRRRSDGLVFVGRLALAGDARRFGVAGGLGRGALPLFVRCSEPLLRRHTLGYALSTDRDRVVNTAFNGSFALGGEGWRLARGAGVLRAGADGVLRLPAGAEASQPVPRERDPGAPSGQEVKVELVVRSASPAGARLRIGLGDLRRSVRVPPRDARLRVRFPAAQLASYDVVLAAVDGTALVDDAAVYTVTEQSAVDGLGAEAAAHAAIRGLNSSLARERDPDPGAVCAGMPRR